MDQRFHFDFSHVRIHNDSKAAESAAAVSAHAYTIGRNVVFGAGQYSPQTPEGRRLLAHELAHVVQQHTANVPEKLQPVFGPAHAANEREADSAAAAMAGGTPVPVVSRFTEAHLQRSAISANERFLDLGALDDGLDMCEQLACNDTNACQDDDKGIECPEKTSHAFSTTKHKWVRHLSCDPECKTKITPCSNDELVIAMPKVRGKETSKPCGQKLTICANHKSVTGTVREHSNKNSWEVSGAIARALGVKPDFQGSLYPEANDPDMKDDRKCTAPREKHKDPPKKEPEKGNK